MPHLVQMDRKYAKKGMVLVGAEVQGSNDEKIKEVIDWKMYCVPKANVLKHF